MLDAEHYTTVGSDSNRQQVSTMGLFKEVLCVSRAVKLELEGKVVKILLACSCNIWQCLLVCGMQMEKWS